jgi:hypothetical protein
VNSLKKVLLIIISLLLVVGCSKTVDTAAPDGGVTNSENHMAEPQIMISSEHRYKEESWISEDVELRDSSITLQGNSFFLTVVFSGNIQEDKLKEAVTVDGFTGTADVTITPREGKTVFYGCYRDIEEHKLHRLIISKDITNFEGKTLKTDIQKEVRLRRDVTADFMLLGIEGIYGDLGKYMIADEYAVGSMNLSPEPKDFMIEFSDEVDKESVEKSIQDGFKDKDIKISFKWHNTKRLEIWLEGFKSGENVPYVISMNGAKDVNGNSVLGNLFFSVGKANELGVIDIDSKSNSVLKSFKDKQFMAIQGKKVDRAVLLDDTESKFVYDIPSDQIGRIDVDDIGSRYTKGIPGFSFLYVWQNENIIMLDRDTGRVLSYSTFEGTNKELFQLPKDVIQDSIIDIAASPDGSKLAVFHETMKPETYGWNKDGFHISVFDMSGNNLKKYDDIFKPRFNEVFGAISDVQWLDNETIILEDNISTDNKLDYNIISINIKTGKKSMIAEHAFKPVVLTGKGIIKVESFEDYGSGERSIDIIKDGKKLRSFKAGNFYYDNFFFSNENIMIYNEGEKIVAYYIQKGKSEVLGNGHVIGLSADGGKIYYMSNNKMLYYIN